MKITIQTQRLKAALSVANKVVKEKTGISSLSNLLIQADNGKATITAGDGSTFLIIAAETESQEPGGCTIPAKIFSELIATISDDSVMVDMKDGALSADVIWTNGKATLPACSTFDYPKVPEIPEGSEIAFSMGAPEFCDAVKMALPAIGDDPLRPVLAAGYFEYGNESICLVGTDSKRMHIIPLQGSPSSVGGLLISKDVLNLLKTILAKEGEVTVYNDLNLVAIKTESITALIRPVSGKYVAYKSVIPARSEEPIVIERDYLAAVLKRMGLADKSSSTVVFELSDGRIKASAQDISWNTSTSEVIPCNYAGAPVRIGFKADMLLESILCFDDETLELHVKSERMPMLIRTPSEENVPSAVMIPTLIR